MIRVILTALRNDTELFQKMIIVFIFFFYCLPSKADQFDVGIIESSTIPGQIDIRIIPDIDILVPQTITAILYTIRWDDPSISITNQFIYPFFILPQGLPVEYNDYYYQVFAATPLGSIAMNANQEYTVSSFTFSNGECASFEIIEDDWTQLNNGNVYFELNGTEVTGIINEPILSFASIGGSISGNSVINQGSSTGPMLLENHSGSVLIWQRKINENNWTNILGTEGLTTYSEVTSLVGSYYYRLIVKNGSCPEVYSDSLHIEVVSPLHIEMNLKVFLEGSFVNNEMTTDLNQSSNIPNNQPYSGFPWYYEGSESIALTPNDEVVDWILVELRKTKGDPVTATAVTMIAQQAGLLLKNGEIVGINGNLSFNIEFNEGIYIIIWHRNHLGIMSAFPATLDNGTITYNFSSGQEQVYGDIAGHKEISSGIWGMIGGNGNGDKFINNSDISWYWMNEAGKKGYLATDFNMNTECQNTDKNDLWQLNVGYESQIPN